MDKEKLMLYSPNAGPRLSYIAGHLVREVLGADLYITGSLHEAESAAIPLVNYSRVIFPGAVNIWPHGLLSETGITSQEIEIKADKEVPVFFHSGVEGFMSFDVFAASFYLISRYEEYLPHTKDIHGRFPWRESLVHKFSLTDEPLVELWSLRLKELIKQKYPRLILPDKKHKFTPTIDVDVPWAYRNRSLIRTAGGFARSLAQIDARGFVARYLVLCRGADDPYYTFDMIEEIHGRLGISPVYFFSTGTYGRYDKCVTLNNREYRKLISGISERFRTGIHPSYRSANDHLLLEKEIQDFASATGNAPVRSRQHYLRLDLPESYRRLIKNGISEDYTMGWAETPGFRAGTCNSFMFYDLEKESACALRVFPFQVMDGSLRDYLRLEPQQAAVYAGRIAEKVMSVGGTLTTLWHNDSFSGMARWKDWNKMYVEIAGKMIR